MIIFSYTFNWIFFPKQVSALFFCISHSHTITVVYLLTMTSFIFFKFGGIISFAFVKIIFDDPIPSYIQKFINGCCCDRLLSFEFDYYEDNNKYKPVDKYEKQDSLAIFSLLLPWPLLPIAFHMFYFSFLPRLLLNFLLLIILIVFCFFFNIRGFSRRFS